MELKRKLLIINMINTLLLQNLIILQRTTFLVYFTDRCAAMEIQKVALIRCCLLTLTEVRYKYG